MIFLLSKYCVQLDIWEVALCMLSRFSYIQLFVTAWTIAHQAPLSMGILQARILEWVAMPSSRNLPNPATELRSPTLQVDSLWSEPRGKP